MTLSANFSTVDTLKIVGTITVTLAADWTPSASMINRAGNTAFTINAGSTHELDLPSIASGNGFTVVSSASAVISCSPQADGFSTTRGIANLNGGDDLQTGGQERRNPL